jgi:hypothetical protein
MVGAIVGIVVLGQLRRNKALENPRLWALGAGITASLLYGLWKFLPGSGGASF